MKDDLLVKVDRASMHYSLETRVPLLDYRIAEFAFNLSADLRYRNGTTKYLLKEVLYEYIPSHFFDRPKWGFSIPLKKWLDKDLSYLKEENLSESSLKKTGILNQDIVEGLLQKYQNKNSKYLYNRLWQLIILQKFLLRI